MWKQFLTAYLDFSKKERTGDMIFVGMCKQYCIQAFYILPEHLCTKIRRGIYYKRSGSALNKNTAPEALIP